MPHHARRAHYAPLEQVSTVASVARRWKKDKKSVVCAIDSANIAARKDGRIWLVYIPSVVAWWGNPPA